MVEKWFVVAKWFGFSDCARTYISILLLLCSWLYQAPFGLGVPSFKRLSIRRHCLLYWSLLSCCLRHPKVFKLYLVSYTILQVKIYTLLLSLSDKGQHVFLFK